MIKVIDLLPLLNQKELLYGYVLKPQTTLWSAYIQPVTQPLNGLVDSAIVVVRNMDMPHN